MRGSIHWAALALLAVGCTSPNPDYDPAFTVEPASAGSQTSLAKGDRCNPDHDLCGDSLRCCEAAVERDGAVDREAVCLPKDWCTDHEKK